MTPEQIEQAVAWFRGELLKAESVNIKRDVISDGESDGWAKHKLSGPARITITYPPERT